LTTGLEHRVLRLAVVIGCFFASGMVAAASCDVPEPIRFRPGTTGAEVTGGIARGEIECRTLTARINQTMSVKVSSTEHNAVMQIYAPGWRFARQDDVSIVKGSALPGVEEGSDTKQWRGNLPATGTYLVVLGTTRGGADYRLEVQIK
jgi:hypothetical protein